MSVPATRMRGASDSSPRKASCSRLRLTCSGATSFTWPKASYNSRRRGGTWRDPWTTDEVARERLDVHEKGRFPSEGGLGRVVRVRRQMAQDGQ